MVHAKLSSTELNLTESYWWELLCHVLNWGVVYWTWLKWKCSELNFTAVLQTKLCSTSLIVRQHSPLMSRLRPQFLHRDGSEERAPFIYLTSNESGVLLLFGLSGLVLLDVQVIFKIKLEFVMGVFVKTRRGSPVDKRRSTNKFHHFNPPQKKTEEGEKWKQNDMLHMTLGRCQLSNSLINDKGGPTTAPATQGLLQNISQSLDKESSLKDNTTIWTLLSKL